MATISDRQFAAFMEQPEYETKGSFIINEKQMPQTKKKINVDLDPGEDD